MLKALIQRMVPGLDSETPVDWLSTQSQNKQFIMTRDTLNQLLAETPALPQSQNPKHN